MLKTFLFSKMPKRARHDPGIGMAREVRMNRPPNPSENGCKGVSIRPSQTGSMNLATLAWASLQAPESQPLNSFKEDALQKNGRLSSPFFVKRAA